MPPNGYSDFNGNLFLRSVFSANISISCLRQIHESCSRQKHISDPLVHKLLKLPPFSLLFQLILSCELVSPFISNPLSYSTAVLLATTIPFKPSLVSLCFPFFHTHTVWFPHADEYLVLIQTDSVLLFLCLVHFRQYFLLFSF